MFIENLKKQLTKNNSIECLGKHFVNLVITNFLTTKFQNFNFLKTNRNLILKILYFFIFE